MGVFLNNHTGENYDNHQNIIVGTFVFISLLGVAECGSSKKIGFTIAAMSDDDCHHDLCDNEYDSGKQWKAQQSIDSFIRLFMISLFLR